LPLVESLNLEREGETSSSVDLHKEKTIEYDEKLERLFGEHDEFLVRHKHHFHGRDVALRHHLKAIAKSKILVYPNNLSDDGIVVTFFFKTLLQSEGETIRDAILRPKKYIMCCPISERPSEERQMSCFLDGLQNLELYAYLFMRKHKNLERCLLEAIEYDDQFLMASKAPLDEESTPLMRIDTVSEDKVVQIVALIREKKLRLGQEQESLASVKQSELLHLILPQAREVHPR
ncbi:hypothetical protein GOP47_0007037, partial [Adiantum capillus-veneris]